MGVVNELGHVQAKVAGASGPRYGHNPAPVYPEIARKHGWQGTVLLVVEIRKDGRPGRVTIKQSSGYPGLDDAAVGAVRRWTFIPAQQEGRPIPSLAEVPIIFALQDKR
jgi:protein TonB